MDDDSGGPTTDGPRPDPPRRFDVREESGRRPDDLAPRTTFRRAPPRRTGR